MFHVNKLPGGERPSRGQVLFLLRGGAEGKEQITNRSCQVMPSYPKSNPVPSQFLPSSFPVCIQFQVHKRHQWPFAVHGALPGAHRSDGWSFLSSQGCRAEGERDSARRGEFSSFPLAIQ